MNKSWPIQVCSNFVRCEWSELRIRGSRRQSWRCCFQVNTLHLNPPRALATAPPTPDRPSWRLWPEKGMTVLYCPLQTIFSRAETAFSSVSEPGFWILKKKKIRQDIKWKMCKTLYMSTFDMRNVIMWTENMQFIFFLLLGWSCSEKMGIPLEVTGMSFCAWISRRGEIPSKCWALSLLLIIQWVTRRWPASDQLLDQWPAVISVHCWDFCLGLQTPAVISVHWLNLEKF